MTGSNSGKLYICICGRVRPLDLDTLPSEEVPDAGRWRLSLVVSLLYDCFFFEDLETRDRRLARRMALALCKTSPLAQDWNAGMLTHLCLGAHCICGLFKECTCTK